MPRHDTAAALRARQAKETRPKDALYDQGWNKAMERAAQWHDGHAEHYKKQIKRVLCEGDVGPTFERYTSLGTMHTLAATAMRGMVIKANKANKVKHDGA